MKHYHPKSCLLAAVILVLFCTGQELMGQTEFTGTTMGPIEYKVVVQDAVNDVAMVEKGINDKLDEINQLMSTYLPTSDLSRLNSADADQWIEVNPLTLGVVAKALQFSEWTEGAFDVTVGPAVNRWKFGPESDYSDVSVEELREYVGFRNIEIRQSPPAIKKLDSRTRIDLSAIAKGFAVDRVASWLRRQGFKNFMVEVGGEVYASGSTSRGGWRIGIEEPLVGVRAVSSVAKLSNKAMATSGDYRNFRMENGRRISHSIDPTNCLPVENNLASVSITADDCLSADAAATAFMVLGEAKGKEFCERQGFEFLYIKRTDNGGFLTETSAGFSVSGNGSSNEQSIWPAFISAMVVFTLAVAGMAVGAIFNNRPITGSCGGIAAQQNEDGSSSCSMCQKPVADCPEREKASTADG